MRRTHLVTVAVAAVLLMAVPAQAEFVPNLVNEQVYFQCTETPKVNNLDGAAGWSTTAPTTSYTEGGGCGQADSGVQSDADTDAEFSGTFTGNLDELTVRLWNIDTSPYGRAFGEVYINATLSIDGVPTLTGTEIILAATPSETGLTNLYHFTVRRIGFLSESHNAEHTVDLNISTTIDDVQANWVYDAAEIDSGIVFNPTGAQRSSVVVDAEIRPPATQP